MTRTMTRTFATFLCGGLLGAALFVPASITAQDKPTKPAGDCGGCCEGETKTKPAKPMPVDGGCCGDEKTAVGDGGMNGAGSDPAAMQAAFEAAARPGENHRKLDALIGTWSTKTTWYCDPTKAQETTGIAVNTWTLGGRFVEQRFFGAMPGTAAAFEGIGLTGFDNVTGKFVGSWLDNLSTTIMPMQGSMDGKTLTLRGECTMPGGALMKFRMVHEFTSADRHVAMMFMAMGDQPEAKGAEVVYTRK